MRLFYKSGIEAAYMAEAFGIHLETEHGLPVRKMGLGFVSRDESFYFKSHNILHPPPFYVCQADVEFFKPREGDKDGDGYVFCEKYAMWSHKMPSCEYVRRESVTAWRDNKAFFMPEIEREDNA